MTTPMMQQWHECKKKSSGVLLFRLGDFYEAFYEDAKILADALGLTLTKRQEIPMAGIPAISLDGYLDKLIAQNFVVAIAEQVEDPKTTKGIVKRDVTRVLSPATYTGLLDESSNNYFASLVVDKDLFGLALLDLSTGEFSAFDIPDEKALFDELIKRRPKELLISKKSLLKFKNRFDLQKIRVEEKDEWHFDYDGAFRFLTHHFKVLSLDGFGLKGKTACIQALGALLMHVNETLSLDIDHVKTIRIIDLAQFMAIDAATFEHLELNSLAKMLNRTATPMGKRLLHKWILHPLLNIPCIQKRQLGVSELQRASFTDELKQIRDLERLIIRICRGTCSPKDVAALKNSLLAIEPLKKKMIPLTSPLLQKIKNDLVDVQCLIDLIGKTLHPSPPFKVSDGQVILSKVSKELDEYRKLKRDSHTFLSNYQIRLREETKIKTLKVGYTRAFGYYIDVSRLQSSNVPEKFERRQTLTNSERYITKELKEYELKILNAEEKIIALEGELFQKLIDEVALNQTEIKRIAKAIATLDALYSLAIVALENGYLPPTINDSKLLEIKGGRHPLVEILLKEGTFVPNDTLLNDTDNQLILITGPNMAGKSTYIRQVALLTLMAQVGSFIPAESATIGIVDKLFTRIGASDNLSKGESTFMVEMTETANILNNATDRSLVILDEIGRGTSTYDGISIASAVAEYLLEIKHPKTLFATHYFELTELENKSHGVQNYRVAVDEGPDGIVFLRKIIKGNADKSYGIHVAKLAGLPPSVIERANFHLRSLENVERKIPNPPPLELKEPSLIEKEFSKLDPNHLTPLQALEILVKWKSYV
ncbi:MAG: DNA mismatch repair protein MutS [Simkaniaceae bacterium]